MAKFAFDDHLLHVPNPVCDIIIQEASDLFHLLFVGRHLNKPFSIIKALTSTYLRVWRALMNLNRITIEHFVFSETIHKVECTRVEPYQVKRHNPTEAMIDLNEHMYNHHKHWRQSKVRQIDPYARTEGTQQT